MISYYNSILNIIFIGIIIIIMFIIIIFIFILSLSLSLLVLSLLLSDVAHAGCVRRLSRACVSNLTLSLSIYIYIYTHISLSMHIYIYIHISLSLSIYIYICQILLNMDISSEHPGADLDRSETLSAINCDARHTIRSTYATVQYPISYS